MNIINVLILVSLWIVVASATSDIVYSLDKAVRCPHCGQKLKWEGK